MRRNPMSKKRGRKHGLLKPQKLSKAFSVKAERKRRQAELRAAQAGEAI